MIKNIEDLKNIQIVCRNQEQVKDCLNYLKQLGFRVEKKYYKSFNIIFWGSLYQGFIIFNALNENLKIEFYNKKLIKTLQKFIKEKQEKKEDFEVAKDGRIIKVNNWMSEKQIFLLFIIDKVAGAINRFSQDCLIKYVNSGFVYATEEARDREMFKLEVETKLKNIAERLNAGRKIDWEDRDQNKYEIYYDYIRKKIECRAFCYCKDQGAIYCLDKNFLNVAKQEIGEENLVKYFKE